MKFLRSKKGKLFLSVALGLTLAWLFYKSCAGGRCLVIGRGADAGSKVQIDTDGTCYRFDRFNTHCQFPHPEGHTDYIPGAGYQDPGYYGATGAANAQHGGHGSIGASYEGFNTLGSQTPWQEGDEPEGFTAGCLGLDQAPFDYPDNAPPYQVACRQEPKWNLPRDARVFHQAKLPCGVPGQCDEAKCHKHHPMDTVYAPPNEGLQTHQVRN